MRSSRPTVRVPSVTVSFNLPDGVSLGEAINRIEEIKCELNAPSTVAAGSVSATRRRPLPGLRFGRIFLPRNSRKMDGFNR
jgi:hypothetical protein